MLRGPSWPASFGTRPPGLGANWWFVSAGSLRPRPAPPVERWRRRWRWGRGHFTAMVARWSWIRDCNAAANLAALAEAATFEVAQVPDRQAAGSLMPLPVQCAFVRACWLVPLLGVPRPSQG